MCISWREVSGYFDHDKTNDNDKTSVLWAIVGGSSIVSFRLFLVFCVIYIRCMNEKTFQSETKTQGLNCPKIPTGVNSFISPIPCEQTKKTIAWVSNPPPPSPHTVKFLAISHLSITISAPFLFISGFLLSISDVSYQFNKPVIFRLAVKFFTDIPLSVKAHPHRLILQVTVAYLPIIYRRIPKLRWTGICF